MHATVLICANDQSTHNELQPFLKEEKLHCISAYSGEEALEIIEHSHIDLLILDATLPMLSALDVIRELRKISAIPVLYLGIHNSEYARIVPLELGADDLVVKPFSPMEVVLRAKVLLRRLEKYKPVAKINFTNLTINSSTYEAYVDDTLLDLTTKEFQLLALLASDPGHVMPRQTILRSVWGGAETTFISIRAIDTHLKRLRKKIPSFAKFEILSIYGVGYKIEKK